MKIMLAILCFFVIYLTWGAEKIAPKYTTHRNQSFITDEFNHVYQNLPKITFQEFEWDPPNVINGGNTNTTFLLNRNGIIIGVEMPLTQVANTNYYLGDRGFSGASFIFRTNTGGPRLVVSFDNASGADVNPPNAKWKVWYIPT